MAAEENNVDTTDQQGGGAGNSAAEQGTDQGTGEKTFTQEEVNKIVEKRLSRERQKIADLLGQDEAEKKLAEREKAVAYKEMRMEAAEAFSHAGIPSELLDLLDYKDKESCAKSVEAVKKAFRNSVSVGVERRLRGSAPPRCPADEEPIDQVRKAFGL